MKLRVQPLRSPVDGSKSFTVVDIYGVPVDPIEDFLAHLAVAKGDSPNTVKAYAHDLKDFFEWLDQHEFEFDSVTVEQVGLFFGWLRRPTAARSREVFVLPTTPAALSRATMKRKQAALASFYRFHARRNSSVAPLLGERRGLSHTGPFLPMLVHTRPSARLRKEDSRTLSPLRISVGRKTSPTLTEQQADSVVDACNHLRDRFLIRLLLESGLRLGEALGLRHENLSLRRGEVEVVPRVGNVNDARAKGLKARIVPVRDSLFDLYADYMELEFGTWDSDFVFINLYGKTAGEPMTADNVEKLSGRLARRSGVAFFTPHVARHTYATKLLRHGVPIETVADLLGHSSIQTTKITYSHLTAEDHRRTLVAAGVLDGAS